MGNRAVITASTSKDVQKSHDIGVYLHWNGGRDSVEAFLTYCKMRGFRAPEKDDYGWARLCQIIGNFFGGDLSIGVNQCCKLDCRNGDNGVYVIKDWEIVGRQYNQGREQRSHDLRYMLLDIDDSQPMRDRIGSEAIIEMLDEMEGGGDA